MYSIPCTVHVAERARMQIGIHSHKNQMLAKIPETQLHVPFREDARLREAMSETRAFCSTKLRMVFLVILPSTPDILATKPYFVNAVSVHHIQPLADQRGLSSLRDETSLPPPLSSSSLLSRPEPCLLRGLFCLVTQGIMFKYFIESF